ncbi:MAG: CocE/NonD family hydrolase [Solirubrobacteraceae bacterium]
MRVEHALDIPMRDGVLLRADAYLPDGPEAVPAVLSRTPYDRSFGLTPPAALDPELATAAGLALVCQDVRGQHGSEGDFYPLVPEAHDGCDTIEWVAAQPWCDGRVVLAGRSYAAAAQWLAAGEQPPALRAMAPVVVGSDPYHGWVYQGGAFQLGFNLFWAHMMGSRKRAKLQGDYLHLPLTDPPVLEGSRSRPFYRDWLEHHHDDAYWKAIAVRARYDRVDVPSLSVGGWYDVFLTGTLENFTRMRREGGTAAAREGARLVIGPWAHGSTYGTFPDSLFAEFGDQAGIDLAAMQLEFFARHLDMEPPAADDRPVRLFVMGENRWRDEDDWPLARAREQVWHLRAGGGLALDPPAADEQSDGYRYDPADPTPTLGGPTSLPGSFMKTNAGPLDQRPAEARDDVLVYSSEPLSAPIEVTGPLSAELHAATDAPDTDWVVRLCDVQPDGTSRILAEGVLRARFREGFTAERLVTPGEPCMYTIDLGATSNVFGAGHRIRVSVTSSSFPRFDRNPNTGNRLGTDSESDLRVARQTVFHDAGRPSYVRLPVVGAT